MQSTPGNKKQDIENTEIAWATDLIRTTLPAADNNFSIHLEPSPKLYPRDI